MTRRSMTCRSTTWTMSSLVALSCLALALPVQAQEEPKPPEGAEASPPSGPAEIIKRAQTKKTPAPEAPASATGQPVPAPAAQAPVPAEMPAQPAGGPAAAPEAGQAPVGGDPHAGAGGAPPLPRRPIATAEPNMALQPGQIHVRVVNAATERPVPNAKLQLGVMTRENTRSTQDATASPAGEYTFQKLATGEGQAYRMNVLHDGAKYSSTPFRLPPDHGYEVVIRQLPTTRDSRELVLYVGATSIELREERLKVVQQARLINIGGNTFVFPKDGQLVKLPAKFTAFQTEEVMTDQHLKEAPGGFRVTGSIPPGEITLTWGFDIPYDTTEVDMSFELPWTTFAYRVLADAAPGMSIAVSDMPPAELHDEDGRRFWVSEVVKRVGETPLKVVKIHVGGIPGPGPMRIIAVVAAVLVLIGGAFIARRPPPAATTAPTLEAFEEQKAALVKRAAALRVERDRGEIGPEFFAEQISDIEEQLAALLYEQSLLPEAKRSAA